MLSKKYPLSNPQSLLLGVSLKNTYYKTTQECSVKADQTDRFRPFCLFRVGIEESLLKGQCDLLIWSDENKEAKMDDCWMIAK